MHLAFLEPRDGVAGRCVGASLRLIRPIRDLSVHTPYKHLDPSLLWSPLEANRKARQGKAILNHTTGQTPALQCDCAPYAGMEVGVDGEMTVCMDR